MVTNKLWTVRCSHNNQCDINWHMHLAPTSNSLITSATHCLVVGPPNACPSNILFCDGPKWILSSSMHNICPYKIASLLHVIVAHIYTSVPYVKLSWNFWIWNDTSTVIKLTLILLHTNRDHKMHCCTGMSDMWYKKSLHLKYSATACYN